MLRPHSRDLLSGLGPRAPWRLGRRVPRPGSVQPKPLQAGAPGSTRGLPLWAAAWPLLAALRLGLFESNVDPRSPCPNPSDPGPWLRVRVARPSTPARGARPAGKSCWGGGCPSFWELFHLRFHNPAVPPTESSGQGGQAPPTTPDCQRRQGPGSLQL